MLRRVFPASIDNDYRGYRVAVWLLGLLLLGKALAAVNAMDLNPYWNNREVLRGVYGIPIATFSATAATTAALLYARWGVSHLMLTVLGFIAIARYRAMIPLLYLLIATEFVAMHIFAELTSIVSAGGASAPMPLVGIAVALIGFGMSLTAPAKNETTGRLHP